VLSSLLEKTFGLVRISFFHTAVKNRLVNSLHESWISLLGSVFLADSSLFESKSFEQIEFFSLNILPAALTLFFRAAISIVLRSRKVQIVLAVLADVGDCRFLIHSNQNASN